MRRWVFATAAAIAAAFTVMLLDIGVVVWSALISAGVLTSATCPDFITNPTTAPVCARPTSLSVVVVATVVAAALAAGFVVYRSVDHGSLAVRRQMS